MVSSLLVSAATSLVAGSVYFYVGSALRGRAVSAAAMPAHVSFLLWWYALGITALAGAAMKLLYLGDTLSVTVHMAATQVLLVMVVSALGGLLYYLVYVYSGAKGSWRLPLLYVLLTYGALQVLIASAPPQTSIGDDGWALVREPRFEMGPVWGLLFTLLFLGPQIGAAIAYAFLWRRATDRTSKYRIALVSTTIIVWFSSSILAGLSNVAGARAWQVSSQLLAITAAFSILVAYKPPRAWRARWGLRSIEEELPKPVAKSAA